MAQRKVISRWPYSQRCCRLEYGRHIGQMHGHVIAFRLLKKSLVLWLPRTFNRHFLLRVLYIIPIVGGDVTWMDSCLPRTVQVPSPITRSTLLDWGNAGPHRMIAIPKSYGDEGWLAGFTNELVFIHGTGQSRISNFSKLIGNCRKMGKRRQFPAMGSSDWIVIGNYIVSIQYIIRLKHLTSRF